MNPDEGNKMLEHWSENEIDKEDAVDKKNELNEEDFMYYINQVLCWLVFLSESFLIYFIEYFRSA